MCGIFFYRSGAVGSKAALIGDSMNALLARGPEGYNTMPIHGYGTLGFTRLAINGITDAGMQPMTQEDRIWICNGEIYNWTDLSIQHGLPMTTGSDCEVIGGLYEAFCRNGISLETLFSSLDGVFALVIVDVGRQQVVVARDPYGVRPLYRVKDEVYASEIKALLPFDKDVEAFPPGHYQVIQMNGGLSQANPPQPYHRIPVVKQPYYKDFDHAVEAVGGALIAAVEKRVNSDREVACLLSGGLDSSLVAALVARTLRKNTKLKTFSIGMEGSPDLRHARMVAEHIGSEHTEVIVTAEELFAAVPEVIRSIESYDTTTVRASVPNWLLGKKIRESSNCKVIFTGDGSDEVWGSYLYFYHAPSDAAYEDECRRLLGDIHLFDVLRSDRCVAAHGLEARVPYLDKEFVATALGIPTTYRRPVTGGLCEKYIMRMAFDDGILPNRVLWRRKEAFSDGVSGEKGWYESAKELAEAALGVGWQETYPGIKTAEQAYYQKCYVDVFGSSSLHVNVPYYWMPRWVAATDPSARTLALY